MTEKTIIEEFINLSPWHIHRTEKVSKLVIHCILEGSQEVISWIPRFSEAMWSKYFSSLSVRWELNTVCMGDFIQSLICLIPNIITIGYFLILLITFMT